MPNEEDEIPQEFQLSPGEVAEFDQIAAEVRDSFVEIPLPLLVKLLNRHRRKSAMERQHMPEHFVIREDGMIHKAVDEIDEWVDSHVRIPYPTLLLRPRHKVMGDGMEERNQDPE